MNGIQFLVGSALPYIAGLVFILGMVYRIYTWAKMPSPTMTLFPRPKNGVGPQLVKEVLFFPGLFKSDKSLWWGAWVFHLTLVFIFLGHFRVVSDFPWLWNMLKMSPSAVDNMSLISGGIAGIIIMLAGVYLVFRRIGLKRVREISGFGDYAVMFLILAILITGNSMRFFQHFDLNETRAYFTSLAMLSPAALPNNGLFTLHYFLAQILIIFIPFSKILHFGGIFFTQTILKRS